MRQSVMLPIILAWASLRGGAEPARVIEHVTVYEQPGRFGGWPANHGIWSWGNEILVGFNAAYFLKRDLDRHQTDPNKPGEPALARSLDGGKTWIIERPPRLGAAEQRGKGAVDLDAPMDFTHPDFAMTLRMTNVDAGRSVLYSSTDRGHTWKGPYKFPLFGQKGIAARTDYMVNGKRDCLAFVTASKSNAKEGRVISVRTRDGGKTWKLVSFIGPEPAGFAIMPSTVRLSAKSLLTTIRHKEATGNWIDAYVSPDNGATWQFLNQPAPDTGGHSGNPPSLIKLKDGRLALTYGYRSEPYGMRARLSGDQGRTWSGEIVLRNDGAAWDLGYPRSLQRPDGKIVTVYYFMRGKFTERYIAATIWDPGTTD